MSNVDVVMGNAKAIVEGTPNVESLKGPPCKRCQAVSRFSLSTVGVSGEVIFSSMSRVIGAARALNSGGGGGVRRWTSP
jgi:hypothetical protein